MLILRRSAERRHLPQGKNEVWQTFYEQGNLRPPLRALGNLLRLDEIRVAPGGALPSGDGEAGAFTYLHRGALKQRSAGNSVLQRAGDFQHRARIDSREEKNASRSQWAHVFRICIAPWGRSPAEDGALCQQERFTAASRHNELCTVASPTGVSGSLVLASDAFIYSSVLDLGQHLVHALEPGRKAWLHMVCGKARVADVDLSEGDGIGVSDAVSLSFTAQEDSEILLVDLGAAPTTLR